MAAPERRTAMVPRVRVHHAFMKPKHRRLRGEGPCRRSSRPTARGRLVPKNLRAAGASADLTSVVDGSPSRHGSLEERPPAERLDSGWVTSVVYFRHRSGSGCEVGLLS
jgi:hypothetical protein